MLTSHGTPISKDSICNTSEAAVGSRIKYHFYINRLYTSERIHGAENIKQHVKGQGESRVSGHSFG
jgi:hypothetical protein